MLQNLIQPAKSDKKQTAVTDVCLYPAIPIRNIKSINMMKDSHLHNKVCSQYCEVHIHTHLIKDAKLK